MSELTLTRSQIPVTFDVEFDKIAALRTYKPRYGNGRVLKVQLKEFTEEMQEDPDLGGSDLREPDNTWFEAKTKHNSSTIRQRIIDQLQEVGEPSNRGLKAEAEKIQIEYYGDTVGFGSRA